MLKVLHKYPAFVLYVKEVELKHRTLDMWALRGLDINRPLQGWFYLHNTEN